ncbi:HAD-IA family hydrolase [Pseudoalteromonas lipolytica]|jgi:putative hydrolase of the HAD superfamily|uniref:HAD-IA family hydrolase n=1 Tax=Pseudoalteromonas lipolytica TaxID=570156 RepID=UPI003BA11919
MIRFNRALSPVSVLSFDLDDTLYNNHPIIKSALQAQADYLANIEQWPADSMNYWLTCRDNALKQDATLVDDVTRWRQAALFYAMQDLGFEHDLAKHHAEQAYQAFADARSQITVADDVLELLEKLGRHFRLIAITNGNVEVEKFNLNGVFELVLQAGPHGKAKPHAALFNNAAQLLNVAHSEILHIGDSLDTDVQGANNAGCQSVWLNNQATNYQYKGLADIEIEDIFALNHLIKE